MMREVFIVAMVMVLLLMVPYMARVLIGPTVFDRLVALNALGTKVSVLLVLVGAVYGQTDMFIDLALALFLLTLVTTLLVARYVRGLRGEKAEVFDA